jgi:hypothetical protein
MSLKASIPLRQTNCIAYILFIILHFAAFPPGSIHLKQTSVGPKGLIGHPPWGTLPLKAVKLRSNNNEL